VNEPSPNINRFWADLIVEELVRQGVKTFFIAPGSRSTPLVSAVVEHAEAEALHFDERGTSFLALGSSSFSDRPSVWITTSGTAVANGLPAVVEASQSNVPLLLLTADRPFELREVGANQTIDQVGIFGRYTRWFCELPAPSASTPPESVLSAIDQAVARAVGRPAGPVHLNLPFREPLAPVSEPYEVDESRIRLWRSSRTPFTSYSHSAPAGADGPMTELKSALANARRGLIVVGGLRSRIDAEAVVGLAESWGWPVVADITSQVRLGNRSELVVPAPHFAAKARSFEQEGPDVVIRFGSAISSRPISSFLRNSTPSVFAHVADGLSRNDPEFSVSHRVVTSPTQFCAAANDWPVLGDPGWSKSWLTTSRVQKIMNDLAADHRPVSEPGVARRVTQLMPEGDVLFLASSMPIRDVDMFGDPTGQLCWVGANRGASGIDGTIASGIGAGIGSGRRVTILCGDLALLHDLNSLALERGRADIIIVLNNDGGGIFSFLPIADFGEIFESWFGAPHGVTFEHAAHLFGLDYHRPETMSAFSSVYSSAAKGNEPTLIEIQTSREANVSLHREIDDRIAAALQ
jgi:2-succinyl-5-enolpyruvyl-6-hydroxy-3-cyclohexene-1-carboxylate synthase